MSKPRRLPSSVEGQTYFVGSTTEKRDALFKLSKMANLFIDTLYGYRKQHKFQVHCFVVMPDHFHLILTPNAGTTLERALQLIKGGFSFRVKHELRMSLEVWERGFTDRRLRVGEYDSFRQYIEQNPVKAGLTKTALEYPYGSASGRFDLDRVPQYLVPSGAKALTQGAG